MDRYRDRLSSASAVATGSAGPGRYALDRLVRYGIGERMIKSAIAAALAWLIAINIHDDPLPVLAPLTAIFTIQLTLARSILGSVQRLLGVGAGVALALLASRAIGVHWWSIGLVVLASLFAGFRVFQLEPAGVEQMTVSGLLVMVVGTTSGNIAGVAGYHILDTVIGTAVGLAANSLIVPPVHVNPVRKAVLHTGQRLIDQTNKLAESLRTGITSSRAVDLLDEARSVAAVLIDVQKAVEQAEESLQFNIAGGRHKIALARFRRANRAIEHAAIQVRVISRTVADTAALPSTTWLQPHSLGVSLANLFAAIAALLGAFLLIADGSPSARQNELAGEVKRQQRELLAAASVLAPSLPPEEWTMLGEIVSVANQLVTDLDAAAAELATAGL